MLTRDYVLAAGYEFTPYNSCRTPGSCEGLPDYAIGCALDLDSADLIGNTHYAFVVTDDDRIGYAGLADVAIVAIWNDDNGFFCHADFDTRADYEDWAVESELADEPDPAG